MHSLKCTMENPKMCIAHFSFCILLRCASIKLGEGYLTAFPVTGRKYN